MSILGSHSESTARYYGVIVDFSISLPALLGLFIGLIVGGSLTKMRVLSVTGQMPTRKEGCTLTALTMIGANLVASSQIANDFRAGDVVRSLVLIVAFSTIGWGVARIAQIRATRRATAAAHRPRALRTA